MTIRLLEGGSPSLFLSKTRKGILLKDIRPVFRTVDIC